MTSPLYPKVEIQINPHMDAADIAVVAVQAMMEHRLPPKKVDEYKELVLFKMRKEVLETTRKWVTVKGAAYV